MTQQRDWADLEAEKIDSQYEAMLEAILSGKVPMGTKACSVIATALRVTRKKAIDEAAKVADYNFLGFAQPYEYSEDIADAIRALDVRL